MGSRLRTKAGKYPVWDEDFLDNYTRLANEVDLLDFSTDVESHGVLGTARFAGCPVVDMYTSLMEQLKDSPQYTHTPKFVEGHYDWRRSNVVSAKFLFQRLSFDFGKNLKEEQSGFQLRFVTHSMGALVLRLGLVQGEIHPANVKDVYHIGPPLLGSPASFRSLVSAGDLPHFEFLLQWVNDFSDSNIALRQLQETLAKFPSIYELMPHSGFNFVHVINDPKMGPQTVVNPLYEDAIALPLDKARAEEAREVHAQLTSFDVKFKDAFPVHLIYCNDLRQPLTDLHYTALKTQNKYTLHKPIPYYPIPEGDGTVPATSSEGGPDATQRRHAVPGCKHNEMCGTETVLNKLAKLEVL